MGVINGFFGILEGKICMTIKRSMIIVVLCILGLVSLIFMLDYVGKTSLKLSREYQAYFDENEIKGEIESIGISRHGVEFKIVGMKKKFIFYPNTSELNGFKIFDHLAEKGDSIIKSRNSDTLRLVKDGKEYLYTFLKPG